LVDLGSVWLPYLSGMPQGSMIVTLSQGLRLGERAWASGWLPEELNLMKVNHIEIKDEPNAWAVLAISAHGSAAKFKHGPFPLLGDYLRDLSPTAFEEHVLMHPLQRAMELALLVEYVGTNWHQREIANAIAAPDGTSEKPGYGFVAGNAGRHFVCKVSGEVV
jgi:hypothetical protein